MEGIRGETPQKAAVENHKAAIEQQVLFANARGACHPTPPPPPFPLPACVSSPG
jgi:hypothetical protein